MQIVNDRIEWMEGMDYSESAIIKDLIICKGKLTSKINITENIKDREIFRKRINAINRVINKRSQVR